MALAPALPDNPDAVRALIRHVVRLPADAPAWDFDPVGPAQLWTRPRDESNLALLELSGRAAEALKGLSRVATDSELGRALRIIVLDLSLIFHPSSEGCFNHWAQVFATLLENFPQQLYAILTTKNGLLHSMLNYVHEGAVYEQLRNIVASAGKQDEKRAEETLRRLADRRFLHMLAERAVASGDPRAQSAADLIVAIIPELLQQAEGERLLKSIDQDFLTEITRPLKNDAATREDLEPALSVIRTLLYYSGRKLEEPATSPTMPRRAIANLLEPFRPALRTALLPLLPGIARRLTHPQQQPKPAAPKAAPAPAAAKDAPPPTAPSAAQAKDALPSADAPAATDGAAAKGAEAKEKKPPATLVAFSAYKVREPFSSYRFALLGIIVELARKYTPEENFFDKLDVEFWRAVVAWFFDYPHNNMLHCMFFRLFSELVRANHEPSLRALLSKGKFLSRMISAYSDKSIDSRAFILAMANMLRLTAASLPRTAFLADFLGAHAQWKSFLPLLLAESMAEQPRTAVAGTHPITPQLTPAWRRVTSYDPADGLELGSSFSKALGFGTNVQDEVIEIGGRAISGEADDTAPRRPMLKAAAKGFARAAAPAIESTPAPRPAPPTASATSPPAPAAAGGKKKKKKKKSAAAAAGANDDDDLEP